MIVTRTHIEISELLQRAILDDRDAPNDLQQGIAIGTARTLAWLSGDPRAPLDSEHQAPTH